MSFDGPALSIDDEGSILFDGEKIIVTVPVDDDLLDHFDPPDIFEVEYTHPSHQQDQQASQGASSLDDNPIFFRSRHKHLMRMCVRPGNPRETSNLSPILLGWRAGPILTRPKMIKVLKRR